MVTATQPAREGGQRRRINGTRGAAERSAGVGETTSEWQNLAEAQDTARREDIEDRLLDLEQEIVMLRSLIFRSPISRENGNLRINANVMIPHQVYEVLTDQGPLQLVKEQDGSIRLVEVYEIEAGAQEIDR